jgi:hypothetical protein
MKEFFSFTTVCPLFFLLGNADGSLLGWEVGSMLGYFSGCMDGLRKQNGLN